jgi:hypothetical protein
MARDNEKVIETAVSDLDELIAMADRIGSVSGGDYMLALRSALPEARDVAVRELVKSYVASGVQTKSGATLSAVKNSDVRISDSKGRARIQIFMKSSGGGDQFYRYANSVNYGRVNSKDLDSAVESIYSKVTGARTRKRYGQNTKRNLKNKIENSNGKGIISVGRGLTANKGTIQTTDAGSKKVQTNMGSATVTKAFNYFYLSPGQKASVRIAITDGAKKYLEEKLGSLINKK